VLDLRGLSDVTDFFIIGHGTSERQVLAIADGIEERLLAELRRKPRHVEGRRTAEWVLLDYVDFVVHVFHEEKRGFYRLERLWGDAPVIDPVSLIEAPARRRKPATRTGR
jgi:ribosome-associated protein